MKQFFIFFLFLIAFTTTNAQIKNGTYDYVIVPQKFDFLKENDSYSLNTLFRYLFKQEGHKVYFDTETFPVDQCRGVFADVIKEKGGLFRTKLKIVIRDCINTVLFESEIEDSKEKEYKKAYHEALRKAFESVKFAEINNTSNLRTKVSNIKEDASIQSTSVKKPNLETKKPTRLNPKKIESPNENSKTTAVEEELDDELDALYAQKIGNGYQLVDRVPKVIMVLLDTAFENVFMVKDQNAIIFKENDKWFFYENTGDNTSKIEIKIKF